MNNTSQLICMKRLKGLSALVTGANSGIGKAVAVALASEGANVAVNYVTNPEDAQKVVQEIRTQNGAAIAIQADVSKEDEAISMFERIYKEFGTIDVLVSNAGGFLCAREAAREFMRRGVVKEKSIYTKS